MKIILEITRSFYQWFKKISSPAELMHMVATTSLIALAIMLMILIGFMNLFNKQRGVL